MFILFSILEKCHTCTTMDVVGVVMAHGLLVYDLDTKVGRSFLGDGCFQVVVKKLFKLISQLLRP